MEAIPSRQIGPHEYHNRHIDTLSRVHVSTAERSPGGICTHWKAPPCHGAHPKPTLGTSHSITSSAVASSAGGTVRPSALAVLRLIAVSNFVGVCTGRSAGFLPRRMRST
jgi:hypothetical protein